MKGLMRSNYYLIEKSFVGILIFCTVIVVAACAYVISGGESDLLTAILGMQIGIFATPTMVIMRNDLTSKWSQFQLTLPVSRNQIVKVNYLSFLILTGCSFILCSLNILIYKIVGADLDVDIIKIMLTMCLTSGLLDVALAFPLVMKFGKEKTDLICMISIFASFSPIILAVIFGNVNLMIVLLIIFSVCCFVGSYFLSCKMFSNKDVS